MTKQSLDSRRLARLINLMADPTNAMTQREIADALGISPRAIRRWKGLPGFGDKLYERLIDLVRAELHLVFKALLRGALRGDVRASKLLLEQVGALKGADESEAVRTLKDWVEEVVAEEDEDTEGAGASEDPA